MKLGHDSRAIGNIFVDEFVNAGVELTIMPLVKLVYIAHGWTLGYTGNPLVYHQAEVWQHGPVIPEVYYAFRPQGVIITEKADEESDGQRSKYEADLSDNEKLIVKEVYKAYADTSAFTLSKMTHRKGTPWYQCKEYPYGQIPNDIISAYYQGRINERKKTS